MAKPLTFQFHGGTVAFDMAKVDRAKLYGYKEQEVLDDAGGKCELATLAEDGHTLVGKGGTGMGYLSADGLWCEKAELKPVDLDGQPISPVSSSFSAPIELGEPTTVDDYLSHTIRSIYVMESADGGELADSIKAGAIYKFPYSFRGGLEFDTAFLLANEAGTIFMAVGSPTAIEFIGLQQMAGVVAEETDTADTDDDDMDFSMI